MATGGDGNSSSSSSLDATFTAHLGGQEESEGREAVGRSGGLDRGRQQENRVAPVDTLSSDTEDSSSSSFSRFRLELSIKQLNDAIVRDRQTAAVLREREKELVVTTRQELAALEQQLGGGSSLDTKNERELRRKQRAILARLKEHQNYFYSQHEELRAAEKSHQYLVKQQQSILAKRSAASRLVSTDQTQPSARLFGGVHQLLDATLYDPTYTEDRDQKAQEGRRRHRPSIGRKDRSKETAAVGQVGDLNRQHEVAQTSDDTDGNARLSPTSKGSKDSIVTSAATTTVVPALLPISPQRFGVLRIRHASGGDSEAEAAVGGSREHCDTTASDQSDAEARVSARKEEVQSLARISARLKKMERRLSATRDDGQLRGQDGVLRKQIEVIDQLISQGQAEVEESSRGGGKLMTTSSSAAAFSRPKIKSPKSSLAASLPLITMRREIPRDPASKLSAPTSPDQSVSLSQTLAGKEHALDFFPTSYLFLRKLGFFAKITFSINKKVYTLDCQNAGSVFYYGTPPPVL